ncbi:MAG: rhodanese-like domain-containing protein [Euryarchaeota archaeon]|nr:rhodanese-like domain-containing protein [Euryarchaeota archaeon]
MNRTLTSAFTLSLLLLSLLLAGCTQRGGEGYRSVTPQELHSMLSSGEDIFLLDVHIPEQRHIPGTDAFIPYNQIKRYAHLLPRDKSAKIVVYCRTGPMSFPAMDALRELGYTNVYYLEGGIVAWKSAGYEVP